MKIYSEERHVKTIPKKFSVLENIEQYFSDFEHKRLQPVERRLLEKAWSWKMAKQELEKTKQGRMALEQLNGEVPFIACEVFLRSGKNYHILKTKSGKEVRINPKFYHNYPNRQIIRRNY